MTFCFGNPRELTCTLTLTPKCTHTSTIPHPGKPYQVPTTCLGEEIVDRLPVLRDLMTSLKKQDQPWKTNGNKSRGDWGGIEQLIGHCVTGSPGGRLISQPVLWSFEGRHWLLLSGYESHGWHLLLEGHFIHDENQLFSIATLINYLS